MVTIKTDKRTQKLKKKPLKQQQRENPVICFGRGKFDIHFPLTLIYISDFFCVGLVFHFLPKELILQLQ